MRVSAKSARDFKRGDVHVEDGFLSDAEIDRVIEWENRSFFNPALAQQ